MKPLYYLLQLLCPYFTKAQQPLTVGDKLPPAMLQQIKTADGQSLATAQQGKWLVLDFMASTCVSCIKLLPQFYDLQQQEQRDLSIVLVTAQPAHKLQSFLQKSSKYSFPIIEGDTLLQQYFPHQTISHLVWVSPGGEVKAITSGYYLTAASFAQAKSGSPLYWPIKQDGKPYDNTKALLTYHPANLQESFMEAPLYYTAMRPMLPGVPVLTNMVTDTLLQTRRYTYINQSLPHIISKMLGRPTMPASYFVINGSNPRRLFYQADTLLKDDWELLHLHCIEMQVSPQLTRQQLLQQFNQTLQQYFQLNATLDTVERTVWQVAGPPRPGIKVPKGYSLQSLGSIITGLNKMPRSQPVVSAAGTPISQKVPMPLPGSIPAEAVLQLLRHYGYRIQSITTPLESIIITDHLHQNKNLL